MEMLTKNQEYLENMLFEMQDNLIHPAIYHQTYGIKTISSPIHPQAIKNLRQGISFLKDKGAQAVILGCTEIPLVITEKDVDGIVTIYRSNKCARKGIDI